MVSTPHSVSFGTLAPNVSNSPGNARRRVPASFVAGRWERSIGFGIERVRFGRCSVVAQKCAECDAVWADGAAPQAITFVQFQILLDILGESEAAVANEVLYRHAR